MYLRMKWKEKRMKSSKIAKNLQSKCYFPKGECVIVNLHRQFDDDSSARRPLAQPMTLP